MEACFLWIACLHFDHKLIDPDNNNLDAFNVESIFFQESLKRFGIVRRGKIWEGLQLFPPLPPRLKGLIPFDRGSVPLIFYMMTNNINFCQFNCVVFDGITNFWAQIFQDIWDNKRVVINKYGE
jgi:hypothetical protein